MVQYFIVFIVLTAAVAYAVYRAWRALAVKTRKGSLGCEGCAGCALRDLKTGNVKGGSKQMLDCKYNLPEAGKKVFEKNIY